MATLYPHAFIKDSVVPFEQANISVASSAVLYGLSVYTVFLASPLEKGIGIFSLDAHFKRLINSARIIGIDTFEKEWTQEKFESAVKELIQKNAPKERVFVRVTVHVSALVPGTYSRGLETTVSMFMYEGKPILPQTGARLKTSVWRRNPDISIPSRAKVNGGYVNSVLARQEAKDAGYDDALFLDQGGHVAELSAANIFLIRNGKLATPSRTHDILEGITRATIFDIATEFGLRFEERTVNLSELYIADEVFACGTSAFVASVKEIDGRSIGNGTMGPITKRVQEKYASIISGEEKEYIERLLVL